MKIIEAPWEKRNLGVSSVNFVIEKKDTVECLDDSILNNKDYEYQTIKLPVNMMDIHDTLNDHGFKFIEGKFELVCDLRKLVLDDEMKEYIDKIHEKLVYHPIVEKNELNFLYEHIKKGIFDTDRIALDKKFGPEKSAMRYYYWTKDEIERDSSTAYICSHDNVPVSFFMIKKINDRVASSLLGGLFEQTYSGYSIASIYYSLLEAKKRGFHRITSEISTNNMGSLRVHLPLGYKIKSMYYVMCKHI